MATTYLDLLKEATGSYRGPNEDVVHEMPRFFSALTNLLDDQAVDGPSRLIVAVALGYMVAPFDAVPDLASDESGWCDDAYLALQAFRFVRDRHGVDVLDNAWPGEDDLSARLEGWLRAARAGLGGREGDVLRYVGLENISNP